MATIITVRDRNRDDCHHGRLIVTSTKMKISMPTSIESAVMETTTYSIMKTISRSLSNI